MNTYRGPTKTKAVMAIAAIAMLLGACSESVKDDAADNKPAKNDDKKPETRTTRGVTDTTIKVGGAVYDVYYGDARVGVEARIKEANDAGGVHGRTIEMVTAENDNNEATRNKEIVQRLIQQEQVFALLPMLTANFGGADLAISENVPTFGWGVNPGFCGNEVTFGITGCVTDPNLKVGSNALGTTLLEHFGSADKTIAFMGEDMDASRGGLALLVASVKDKGFKVVLEDSSLPAPPDVMGDPSPFTSKLLKAADGNAPDVIYLISTLSGTKLANALLTSGYKGMIVTPSYSPLLLSVPGYNGTWVNTQLGMDPALPANAKMLESVHALKPDLKLNLAVSAGYWAADMFIKALEKTGKDLTVEKLLATLNGGDFTYEVTDVVGRSEWPANHDQSVPCSALTEVVDGAFVPRIPLTCGENITVG